MPPSAETEKIKQETQTYDGVNTQSAIISVKTATGDKEVPVDIIQYFMDDNGKYYYQSTVEVQISAINEPEANPKTEEAPEMSDPVLADPKEATSYVTPETDEDVSFVLVVQDDNEKAMNVDLNGDKTHAEENENDGFKTHIGKASEDEEEEDEVSVDGVPKKQGRGKNPPPALIECNFCSYTTFHRYLLTRHMRSHSEDRPYKCNVCERGFKSIASLQNHLNMHNGIKPHDCKACNSSFTTSGELARHVRYKHTNERPHKCTECDYASVELSKLRRHIRCHTGEKPYQCEYCTYASLDAFKLKRHIRTHTGEKPYLCESCSSCFTQSNSLKAHQLIHNISEKPVFSCLLCPAKCGRKTDLRIHVQKQHTSDKPLKCRTCEMTFPDRYTYKVHVKTHSGEKCFKCNLCAYASTTLRYLNMHMYLHSQEKPFVCNLCDSAFRQKQLLRRHMNLYHDPNYVRAPAKEKKHTCNTCERTFAHKGNLIRHLAVHELKFGRLGGTPADGQKKLNIINKRPLEGIHVLDSDEVEVMKRGLDDIDKEPGKLVTVTGDDGQQYVMLDVIQLEDGTELQVIVPPAYTEEDGPGKEREEEEEEGKHRDTPIMKFEKDDDACFGFNEDEEDLHVNYDDYCV